jgi:phosphoribosylcarboxyaminoimidazole (NCAIR) mutase
MDSYKVIVVFGSMSDADKVGNPDVMKAASRMREADIEVEFNAFSGERHLEELQRLCAANAHRRCIYIGVAGLAPVLPVVLAAIRKFRSIVIGVALSSDCSSTITQRPNGSPLAFVNSVCNAMLLAWQVCGFTNDVMNEAYDAFMHVKSNEKPPVFQIADVTLVAACESAKGKK